MTEITRRTFVAGVGAGVTAAGTGKFNLLKHRGTRPNIILFIADDMRYDAAGFAGNKIIQTPRLDQLAKESSVFDNMFVTTSICPISRASIMSGEYALRHHVYTFFKGMKPASFAHSFPVLLRKAGYYTGFIGKWGQAGKQPDKAFDKWMGYIGEGLYYWKGQPDHLTDFQTKQALKFIRIRPKNKPFLLIVAYKSPHGPWIPQKRYKSLYKDIVFPRSVTDTKEDFDKLPKLLKLSHGKRIYNNAIKNSGEYQRFMQHYFELITGLDESIGIVLDEIRKESIHDTTSILFTSDNGLLNGEHGLLGKWNMYESSIRVPLIVQPAKNVYPNYKPDRLTPMALNIDISPTILSMASEPIPENIQGSDLMNVIRNPKTKWREGFYYEHPPGNAAYHLIACEGYRTSEWKYTRYHEGKKSEECLFNLKEDPLERNNLAYNPAYAAKKAEMKKRAYDEKARLMKADV